MARLRRLLGKGGARLHFAFHLQIRARSRTIFRASRIFAALSELREPKLEWQMSAALA